ncbi:MULTISPECIES: GIY-YIG nuclease family protein [unclassified Lysinibacillus]|uniref:GIY-YIG nuclease family protein n=1 Tax=unclassified Lysinibacillus TaxID=2636778 RepID=UPI00201177E3|nr:MULTISPECIES: GIY-YIG nuclease family protein [unclassified Lysinibacillus]MCL1698343.1 GIY-YIG nuclease family protein [Lysinibacillus sp. BPa_S21]MCL1702571.1 GIY-YIG nuclease family protein [Lysinibacillus sp. Bpr_S20]
MVHFYLSDLLKRCHYNLDKTLLIRHSLKNERFIYAYRDGFLREYTQNQSPHFFDNYDHVIVFSADEGTTSKYLTSYEVRHGEKPNISSNCSPYLLEPYKGQIMHPLFDIPNDPLRTYENKLYIEWGKAAVRWYQKSTNDKIITQLVNTSQFVFPGYENVLLTFQKLKEIIDNSQAYADWHIALSAINAIYAITDRSNGKIYIGSSYNKSGLLGRWSDYATTIHGGNEAFKQLLAQNTTANLQFQYTILKVLPKDITALEAIEIENNYKRKLQTIPFGYNCN